MSVSMCIGIAPVLVKPESHEFPRGRVTVGEKSLNMGGGMNLEPLEERWVRLTDNLSNLSDEF